MFALQLHISKTSPKSNSRVTFANLKLKFLTAIVIDKNAKAKGEREKLNSVPVLGRDELPGGEAVIAYLASLFRRVGLQRRPAQNKLSKYINVNGSPRRYVLIK